MKVLLAVVAALALCGCGARSVPREEPSDRLSVRLTRERQTLERSMAQSSADPVARTKTLIRISDILLTFAHRAAVEGETGTLRSSLSDYLDAVALGRRTMIESGRDARKKTDGFMDLEIALRRQLRELQDIQKALAFDDRAIADEAIDKAEETRNVMLNAVMGAGR
jgi:hypothetical protein